MQSIKNAPIAKGLRVLVRADIDVPIEGGKILEDYRLQRSLPTLQYIQEHEGFPVIMGHIGKPNGKHVPELSTEFLEDFYTKHLGQDKYELMENLRFNIGEETNDKDFVKTIARYGAIYVNDSFAASHRGHASIVGLPTILSAYAGLELEAEVNSLNKILQDPQKPLIAIVGGAKLESKKPTISNLLKISDFVLVGGKIGLEWNEEIPQNLLLPLDYAENNKDIGPATIDKYEQIIKDAKTVIWAGPMGIFEDIQYRTGTSHIAAAVAKATQQGCFSVIGGGDTIAALNIEKLLDKISFVSTGGGAMLEFLAKGTLPGIEALKE